MSDSLVEGQRIGRFIIVRDISGQRHAIAAGAVTALAETDDGALILLAGGRMVHLSQPLQRIIQWLGGT